MKNVFKLAKSVLIPSGLTAAASVTDVWLSMTTLINSNEQTNNIIKIVMSLGDAWLLIKGVSGTMEYEAKE